MLEAFEKSMTSNCFKVHLGKDINFEYLLLFKFSNNRYVLEQVSFLYRHGKNKFSEDFGFFILSMYVFYNALNVLS